MAKGTVSQPKPPTARQVQKTFATFEQSFNAIVELTKRFEPGSIAGIEAGWIRDKAFDLHDHFKALCLHVVDEENETR